MSETQETASTKNPPREFKKVYLGDGLYMDSDGWQIRLYGFNGIEAHDQVFLEPMVLDRFLQELKDRGIIK